MLYLDKQGIKEAFANHLRLYRDYTEDEMNLVLSDFPDPYVDEYLLEEYVDDCEIDGVGYEQYATVADFTELGVFDIPSFCFYTFYRAEDVPNQTIGEYHSARKLYQVDDLDKCDFPEMEE